MKRNINLKERVLFFALALILALGLVGAPVIAFSADDQAAAQLRAELVKLAEEAKSVDLTSYDKKYADQVRYAAVRAANTASDTASAADDLNIAKLTLQSALDTLTVDLQLTGVAELQNLVKTGKLTYTRLMEMYLTRIELYDKNTVKINAVRALNPNALALAKACDLAFAADPEKATGIFGMPIMVKDNVGTIASDGMPTAAGSVALADNYQPYDAPLIAEIKAAGGIILGKLNLTEFANYMTNGMPSGYSSLGGYVMNPYKPWMNAAGTSQILTPSGSSAGSGAAAATALSAITIGTETSGSILSPTQANSIVGIKPTVGLVSRTGVVPLSSTQDTAGPMGRSVSDVAALLTVVAAYDPKDVVTAYGADIMPDFSIDYTKSLNPDGLNGKRVGLYGTPSAANREVYNRVAAVLRSLGATIVTNGQTGGNDTGFSASASSGIVLSYDFKKDMNAYLATLAPDFPIKTLADIIQYNSDHADAALRFGQTTLISSNARDLEAQKATYEANRAAGFTNSRANGIDRILKDNNLDALFTIGGGTTGIAAVAGYPTVSVPAGYNNYAPDSNSWGCVNVGFTGTAYSEAELISMAYAYEQATHARIVPGLSLRDSLKALVAEASQLSAYDKGFVTVALSKASTAAASNFSTQMEVDEAFAELEYAIGGIPRFSFTDGEGKAVTSLSGKTLDVSCAFINRSAKEQKLTMYVAVYKPNGQLAYVSSDEKVVDLGETRSFNVSLDMADNADGNFAKDGYYANVFLWETDTFVPVIANYVFGK